MPKLVAYATNMRILQSIMLGFSKDRVAVISSNWLTPLRVREFEGVCSDAVISLDFITQEVKISGKETEILPVDKKEPLSLEIQSFLGALVGCPLLQYT